MDALLLALALGAAPPPVASPFDPARFAGTWYELARLPNLFERGCEGATATYTPRPDGRLDVLNKCRKGGAGGKIEEVHGEAWAPDAAEPAKLKLQFFWPFKADYWVFEVAPDYSYALVGHPERKSAWLLCRKPTLDAATYDRLVSRLRELGFDAGALERVPQS